MHELAYGSVCLVLAIGVPILAAKSRRDRHPRPGTVDYALALTPSYVGQALHHLIPPRYQGQPLLALIILLHVVALWNLYRAASLAIREARNEQK